MPYCSLTHYGHAISSLAESASRYLTRCCMAAKSLWYDKQGGSTLPSQFYSASALQNGVRSSQLWGSGVEST
ncbi:hypothetical protein Psta_2651 [Pirellula staleyi DSM 6068]|uniref:Uncharacterized protein n=1 Tax=Pirellula staleyi (strain ATCC 27377 / DSM 6068 / ICPB 4128) TaxID=530564 RepID=D2R6M0_PIRSD|nr:hypothetical protein Psta_2651 [Pirellula staleyi DSM 6068]